jgi:internalin A
VLVVLNKIDENPSFEVERKSLSEKYPRITGFYRLSCAQTEHPGFIEFREALRRQIEQADTRRTPFPRHWLAVKRRFVEMQEKYDYIESAEYRRVCQELGVTRRLSQDVLLQFLHDLGVLINFRDLQYFDTQILNPLWLTNGVYRIINSSIVAEQGGLLREMDFDAVINDPRYQSHNTSEREFIYPKNKLHYIVRVMQEFELCFPISPSDFIVPQLLPANAPEFAPDGAVLRFVMHFPAFLPNSVFPRLMVKLHDFIRGNERWRTGMVLHKASVFDALARVRWDKEDQQLLINICGNERRRLLSFIRETVKEIVADFTGLEFVERVPVPDCGGYKDYDELVAAEKAGESEIFVKELKKRIAIASLLDGIEEAAMRDENRKLPVKAFVSYAHKDLVHLKTLQAALSPLVRLQNLQLWDDRDIEAGEEWLPEILQQLEQADIMLCLVSPDFVNSDFCYLQEFQAALDAHRCGEKAVVPIMLRKTDWQDLPLAAIQAAPGEWICSAADQDGAWCQVSERLRPVIEAARARKVRKLEVENLPTRTRLGAG